MSAKNGADLDERLKEHILRRETPAKQPEKIQMEFTLHEINSLLELLYWRSVEAFQDVEEARRLHMRVKKAREKFIRACAQK